MMAKRGYKLQEFVAHPSNVNCLNIAKKTCRLFVTGGDDCKINLWSIGKPTPLMSLSGHTSPVESLAFEPDEVRVLGGASAGAIKLWDLEEAKLVRSLTGHRANCTAVEFHPFGEFFASGSSDTNLKIWDIRKKSCIHTYKGHTGGISTIKFSPDGRWIVTGGLDNTVKVWDLTAGKLLNDFKFHDGPISCINFHPLEFLLATGSADKTVKFWDLETFELIGSTKPEDTAIRAISFNPDGKTLFCGMNNGLKVFSWEPILCHDTIELGWSTVGDLCVHERKLVGCSYYRNSVGVWVVDISLIKPYGSSPSPQVFDREEKAADKSVIHPADIKEIATLLSCTPSSTSSEKREDVKNIYIDCANGMSVTSRSSKLSDSREMNSLDKRGTCDSSIDNMGMCDSPSKRTYNPSGVSLFSREPAASKDSANSKRETIAFTRTKPGMLLRPASVRKPFSRSKGVEKFSQDLDLEVHDSDKLTSTPPIQLKECSEEAIVSSHRTSDKSVENSRISTISSFGLVSSVEPAPPESQCTGDDKLQERSESAVVHSNLGHLSSAELAANEFKRNEYEMRQDRSESFKAIPISEHYNSTEAATKPKCNESKILNERSESIKVSSTSGRLISAEAAANNTKCNESKIFKERSELVIVSSNVEHLSFAEPAPNYNKSEMLREKSKSVKGVSKFGHLSYAEPAPSKPKCNESKTFQERSESVNKADANFGSLSSAEPARSNPKRNEPVISQESSASSKVINAVAVKPGRTRSLVEKFERQEKLCSSENHLNTTPPYEFEPKEGPCDTGSTPTSSVYDVAVTPTMVLAESSVAKDNILGKDEALIRDPIKSLLVPSENLAQENSVLNQLNISSSEIFVNEEKMRPEDQSSTASSVSIEELSINDRPNTPQNSEPGVGKHRYDAPSNVISIVPSSSKSASRSRIISRSSNSINTSSITNTLRSTSYGSSRNLVSTKPQSPNNFSSSTSLLISRTTRDSKPTARMRSFAYGRAINQRRNSPDLASTMESHDVSEGDDMSSGGVDISVLLQPHDELLRTLQWRLRRLQMIRQFWDRNDLKGAIDGLTKLPDPSVQADVVSLLIDKMQILTLDLFSLLLPVLVGLLESNTDRHASVSLDLLLKLVGSFGSVIRSTVSARPTVGVDIQAQERREYCNICHLHLQKVEQILPSLSRRSGLLAKSALELSLLFQQS